MTDQLANISRLEKDLWEAADNLRANSKLTSSEYCMPVLGIIFLRQAANRFDAVTTELKAAQSAGKMPKRRLIAQDYVKRRALWLPEESHYDMILKLPAEKDLGEALIIAMEKIEESFEALAGVLPKEYTIFERTVLEDLLRTFDRDALRTAGGDIFGRIYEYFLMKFAMQGAQDNGEFFTPPSIVQTIVNVIEPTKGKVLDPAVGSAGMFVQSSHFVERMGQDASHNLTFYGQEKTATTIRLAKMNLAVHGLEGDIREANTFYEDAHSLVGKCDYVMANPPFNVDMVDAEKVKGDVRLPFGLPGVNKQKKVSNGNYLWIQYFYSYLNRTGRAGFVMATGAETAGGEEQTIRQKLIETDAVDAMITIGTNFFYTRPVPCMLWFFDRGKPQQRRDKVLMIDARGIYRKVTRVINDFSAEQLQNIASLVWLHRGERHRYLSLVRHYLMESSRTAVALQTPLAEFTDSMGELVKHLSEFATSLSLRNGEDAEASDQYRTALSPLTDVWNSFLKGRRDTLAAISKHSTWTSTAKLDTNAQQHDAYQRFESVCDHIRSLRKLADVSVHLASASYDIATKKLAATRTDSWMTSDIRGLHRNLIRSPKDDEDVNLRTILIDAFKQPPYFQRQIHWLQSKFPQGDYADVEGLCRSVDRQTIAHTDWSLAPGRYVGVAAIAEDPDFDFEEWLTDIQQELCDLNAVSVQLAQVIDSQLQALRE